MELEFKNENGTLTVKVIGKLDTMTAPKLEEELSKNIEGVNSVVFDLEKLTYISSSGIRILIATGKQIKDMKLLRPNDDVMEIFTMTGLTKKFNIEK